MTRRKTSKPWEPHRRQHRNNTIETITHLRCCQAASSSHHLNTHRRNEALWGAMSLWLHRQHNTSIAAPSSCPDSFRVIRHHYQHRTRDSEEERPGLTARSFLFALVKRVSRLAPPLEARVSRLALLPQMIQQRHQPQPVAMPTKAADLSHAHRRND